VSVTAALSAAEFSTLEIIAADARNGGVSRGHLEKLSRLDLIEPCPQGICMTLKGKGFLAGRK
jgi:hypothetical protein